MRNESVAVLDIRSGEVSFLIGSKGVNATFVFKGSHTESYEGYSLEGIIDDASFQKAVTTAVTTVGNSFDGKISKIYVGVPSAFTKVYTVGHTVSFPRKRKISKQDVEVLYDNGLNKLLGQGRCIRRSAMYFTLGDNRKYFSFAELRGVPTTMLKGALCYYFVSEEFYAKLHTLLSGLGFADIQFLPSTLAQATYLLPRKNREGYALLLDMGFLTSSISVIYGNGVVHEETFNCGAGTILVSIMENFDVDYAEAEEILAAADISGSGVDSSIQWTTERGKQYSVQAVNDAIKCSLDVLCESVDNFLESRYKDRKTLGLSVNPIEITGEGIGCIKGAAEHISRRLNRLTQLTYPDLPYYDKPAFSSRIALLATALQQEEKQGWLYKLLKGFGGN